MKKIPSVFVRDWSGDRSRLLPQVAPGCDWVLEGAGWATRKWDGSACLIQDGRLWKRFDAKRGRIPPTDFLPAQAQPDSETGHWPGWVPVGDRPEDRWHQEAWKNSDGPALEEGTYELLGPKVQNNPEQLAEHQLIRHGAEIFDDLMTGAPRTFESLRDWLAAQPIEGIVFYGMVSCRHPWIGGDMAKLKRRDFGLPWPVPAAAP